MKHLSIDIETYSSVDIKKSGLYKYVESPDFQILLFAYSVDFQPVQIIDLTKGELIPRDICIAMTDDLIIKHAYNAPFEWYCLSKYLGLTNNRLDRWGDYHPDTLTRTEWLKQWRCSMLHGLYCGYTAGLAATGEALGLPQDKRKLGTGKALINYFCKPCKPTRANGNRTRNLPQHDPDKWNLFKEYCIQDVVTEMEIYKRLSVFPVPDQVQKEWELDQQINATGIKIDTDLVEGALYCSQKITDELMAEAIQITGLDNPKSVAQLKKWLEEETDTEIESLNKAALADMVKCDNPDHVQRMLKIRQELGKTSVKKYSAMENAICPDGRVRGLLQFYGANRTGRWAGRLVQVQNLPKNKLETLDLARLYIKAKSTDMLKVTYGNIPDTLSQLIRTAFIPSDGHKFVVADFSAIEARVIAWLAGESWRQEVFKTHGRIYEASASAMFGVPIEKISKGNPEYALRAKGKVAELALGYQGAAGALIAMGALGMGLSEEELPDIVRRWRDSNKQICNLWYTLERAALQAVETCQPVGAKGLMFAREGDYATGQDFFTITLPSGRKLFYAKPVIRNNDFGKPAIHYMGIDQNSKKWGLQSTYGGKLTENVVQAIARDCLAITLQRLADNGFQTVMHIHDEAVIDCPAEKADLETACNIMRQAISWAPGLILNAAGFVGDYYMKD